MKIHFDINQLIKSFSDKSFIEAGVSYSYLSFFAQVYTTSQALKQHHIKENDIVILHKMVPNEAVIILFALWHLKAVAFPVNPKITDHEFLKIVKSSKAACVISEFENKIKTIKPIEILEPVKNEANIVKADWDYKKPAIIILTSGSSAKPKMAVHSLAALMANAKSVNTFFNSKNGDRWLLSLPLYHVAGLAIIFRCMLSGSTLCIPQNGDDIFQSLEKFKPTHLSLVPTQLWRLLKNKPSVKILEQCKVIFLGGSSIPQTLINESLKNNLKIYTSYGLTEMASTVAIKEVKDNSTDKAKILAGYQTKISKDGELLLKGDALFLGYLKNAKVENSVNNDGWFHTGDLAVLEDDGRITVIGRKDNMFISGGENIYPEEIEKHLLMIDEIQKAVVVAIEDDEFGRRPVAFIKTVSKPDSLLIVNFLKQFLPSFKIPDRFLPWPKDYIQEGIKINRHHFRSLL